MERESNNYRVRVANLTMLCESLQLHAVDRHTVHTYTHTGYASQLTLLTLP